ncbi:hypothetical protein LSTR_LSTR014411 [Laodelphax striatellus]|uniref:Uncharacterized protein n=1 Tax=Laodelphax striatellus TaxID=195883 RepID=A0A482X3M0_LAOST|nr:hypothetical protein LSTR_LSTR014411 [Laodelphax striatellus]
MANQNKLFTVLESDGRTVPKTLELIIKNIEEHVENVTENHLLIGVMYTLMLECGYYLSSRDAVAISDDDSSNCSHDKVSYLPKIYLLHDWLK